MRGCQEGEEIGGGWFYRGVSMAAEARETRRTSKNEYNLWRGMGQTGRDDPRMVRIDARKGIDGQARAEHIVHRCRREELAGKRISSLQ